MTTKQLLHKMLTDNGMFDNQADKVLEQVIPIIESLNPGYRITWNSDSSEYPDIIYTLWRTILFREAYKWCEKHAPQAWFKDIFKS